MRPFKYILLGILATIGVFSMVVTTSCSKNECGAVTCLNKGQCRGGICQCLTGIYGVNCEVVDRVTYAGTYAGLYPFANDTTANQEHKLIFAPTDDTTDFSQMQMVWLDTSGLPVVSLAIKLDAPGSSGTTYSVTDTLMNNIRYTGSGLLSTKMATLKLNLDYGNGTKESLYFNNYMKL